MERLNWSLARGPVFTWLPILIWLHTTFDSKLSGTFCFQKLLTYVLPKKLETVLHIQITQLVKAEVIFNSSQNIFSFLCEIS
jgi:hypothetical protein